MTAITEVDVCKKHTVGFATGKCSICLLVDALQDIVSQLNGMEGRQYRWIRNRAQQAIDKAIREQPEVFG